MKTDVKARTKDAIDQTVTEAKDRGQQAVSRGQRALARGWDAVTRQQQAIVGKVGETARKPAAVWTGAGIGAALGVGVAADCLAPRARPPGAAGADGVRVGAGPDPRASLTVDLSQGRARLLTCTWKGRLDCRARSCGAGPFRPTARSPRCFPTDAWTCCGPTVS